MENVKYVFFFNRKIECFQNKFEQFGDRPEFKKVKQSDRLFCFFKCSAVIRGPFEDTECIQFVRDNTCKYLPSLPPNEKMSKTNLG